MKGSLDVGAFFACVRQPDKHVFKEDAVRCQKCGCRATLRAWNTRALPVQAEGREGLEDNPAYDEGITYAIRMLAQLTDSKDWQIKDGSENHDQDVCYTIMDVLKCAGLYDDETGKFAALSPSGKGEPESGT